MVKEVAKQALIDYQTPLEIASRSMIRFKKPERLIKMIVRMISEQIGVTHAAVLLYVEDRNYYKLIESKGTKGKKIPIGFARLNPDSALIRVFTEKKNRIINGDGVLIYQELQKKKIKGLDKFLSDIKKQMEILGAEVCIPSYFKGQLLGILILGARGAGEVFSRKEIGLLVTLANDAAMAISNAQLIESLQQKVQEVERLYIREHSMFIHTSIALAAAIDAKDPYTHGHTARVTKYALEIFRQIREKKCNEEALHIAALLHDIGKIGIPDAVLNKKDQLNNKEHSKMQEHAAIGATILSPIKEIESVMKGVIEGVKHHHEKFDGSGYPGKLKRWDIPFIARIIAVADTFDAMTSDRPYRKGKSFDEAVKEILKHSGKQFDPEVVKAFLAAYEKGRIVNRESR